MDDGPDSETQVGQAMKCLTCGAVIQSKHRHDFVMCDCGLQSDTGIYVDGGTAYFRMGVGKDARYEVVNEEARDA